MTTKPTHHQVQTLITLSIDEASLNGSHCIFDVHLAWSESVCRPFVTTSSLNYESIIDH